MYTYRIELDAYGSADGAPGARVVTYSRGWCRDDALRKLGAIRIAQDGTVSDGINPWPGTRNLPAGPHRARTLREWEVRSIRTVPTAGKARIID